MQVRITPSAKQKFVLVRLVSGGEESLFLWGNPDIQWHKDIVEEMSDAGYQVVEPLGGGWLYSKPGEGVVYVWGKSDRFGVAPIDLVKEILGGDVIEQEPEQ